MNRRAVQAIVGKDLKVVAQSKAVVLPLIIVPVIMLVVLPGLAALIPAAINLPGDPLDELEMFVEQMPASLKSEIESYTEVQRPVALLLVYFLAPMYLIIPLMVSSVIAADSFAGEKERKTLEALLYTPTTDEELFLAKLLAAWLPAVAIALGGGLLYCAVANLAAWPVMGRVFLPNAMWVILVLWVAPAVAGLGLGVTVLVSSRVNTFQEAYQMGGIVVLPVVALVIGQALGVMYLSVGLVVLLGAVVWVINGGLFWYGSRTFQRNELIARL